MLLRPGMLFTRHSRLHQPCGEGRWGCPRQTRSPRAVRALVCLALGVVPLGAHAQTPETGPTEVDRGTARTLMDAGRAKEQAGDLKGALKAYSAADRIMQVPTTALSVARMHLALGNLVEAHDAALRATRYPTKPAEAGPIVKARQQAKALTVSLIARIPVLTLEVTGAAPGATVTTSIDGEVLGNEELGTEHMVNPGSHRIVASAEGHQTARQSVTLREAERATVHLALELEGAASSAPAAADQPVPQGTRISPVAWVGFGVAGAGLVVGIATGAVALSKRSALGDACPDYDCPAAEQDELDSMTALAHTSTVSLVVAGVGLGVGLVGVLALSDLGSGKTSAEPAVSLELGPGSLGVRGRF